MNQADKVKLTRARELVGEARDIVEEFRDGLQETYDEMTEKQQESDKGETLAALIGEAEDAASSCEEADGAISNLMVE